MRGEVADTSWSFSSLGPKTPIPIICFSQLLFTSVEAACHAFICYKHWPARAELIMDCLMHPLRIVIDSWWLFKEMHDVTALYVCCGSSWQHIFQQARHIFHRCCKFVNVRASIITAPQPFFNQCPLYQHEASPITSCGSCNTAAAGGGATDASALADFSGPAICASEWDTAERSGR